MVTQLSLQQYQFLVLLLLVTTFHTSKFEMTCTVEMIVGAIPHIGSSTSGYYISHIKINVQNSTNWWSFKIWNGKRFFQNGFFTVLVYYSTWHVPTQISELKRKTVYRVVRNFRSVRLYGKSSSCDENQCQLWTYISQKEFELQGCAAYHNQALYLLYTLIQVDNYRQSCV